MHFDRAEREFRIKVKDWVRNPFPKIEAPPVVVEDTIDTSLLRLHRRTIDLKRVDSSILPGGPIYWPGSGSAMAVKGRRALIANRRGNFYELAIDGPAEAIRKTPLTLETGYQSLLDFTGQSHNEHDDAEGNRYVGVTDLLFLTDRESLAVAYTFWNSQEKCVTSRVAVLNLRPEWWTTEGRWRVVFESAPCLSASDRFRGNQVGGRLAEISPGVLYLAIGDFGHDGVVYEILGHDDETSYGKVIEINIDKTVYRVVSTGHRNPEGLTRDSHGQVWSTEHGPQGGDELNLIRAGKNYGWPHVTLGTNYGQHTWPLSRWPGRHDGYAEPIYAWTPSIGVNNLIELRNFSPEWNGDLVVVSLIGRRLGRLRMSQGRVVLEEPIRMSERLRDIDELDDGRIVLWTDSAQLVVLSVAAGESRVEEVLAKASPPIRAVIHTCAECHSFSDSVTAGGRISLLRIHGRRFAAGDPELYSDALKKAAGQWDSSTLDRYLESPQRMIPGTTMQYRGITDDALRAEVVRTLGELR